MNTEFNDQDGRDILLPWFVELMRIVWSICCSYQLRQLETLTNDPGSSSVIRTPPLADHSWAPSPSFNVLEAATAAPHHVHEGSRSASHCLVTHTWKLRSLIEGRTSPALPRHHDFTSTQPTLFLSF